MFRCINDLCFGYCNSEPQLAPEEKFIDIEGNERTMPRTCLNDPITCKEYRRLLEIVDNEAIESLAKSPKLIETLKQVADEQPKKETTQLSFEV